jgi:trehalose 6-phosphate phosphatase
MTTGRSLDDALRLAASTPRLLVASDFDGTLAEIVSRPELAVANPVAVSALVGLAALPATDAAVVSGRSRQELTKLAGDPSQVILVGGPGAEWDDPLELSDDRITALATARALVEEVAAAYPGSMVEPKQAAVVLHTRGVGNRQAADRAASMVRDAANDIQGVAVLDGKEVVELAVTHQTKGSALVRLRRRVAATTVVFLGDDLSDETGFEVLEPADVGVKVGPGPTTAGYRIGSVEDVAGTLDRLLDLRRSQ